ncbi:MAG: chemotaxis protein CheB [Phycisphaerales bacterium]|nr:chemotaxis protein CheB [Hyphomonadaceae bacterium]
MRDFALVCVGGSAGSLNAYKEFLQYLPEDLGVAIVIVNHVARGVDKLHEILPRHTKMPVNLITDGLRIQPNHVYIIPAKFGLHLSDDAEFHLAPLSKTRGWPDVITLFLRSLTRRWDGKLIAVIVSGLDGDGAAAMGHIKDVGGITFAQAPDTAEWSDMPEEAIKTGYVDFVLSAGDIALKIAEIVTGGRRSTHT